MHYEDDRLYTIPYGTWEIGPKYPILNPKIWALYYGQGELYGMSTSLNRLEQKKKDLEILYELALSYQNDCFKAMEVLGEKYKLSDLMEYEKECEKYTKNDKNIRFYNLKIVEIPNL